MWQFCLQLNNEIICEEFYLTFKQALKNFKGVVTKYNTNILFAYNHHKVKNIIKTEIVKYIILKFKVSYFENKLKNVQLNDIKKNALIKVLSMFDNKFDTLFVTSELEIDNELVLESFIRFSLKDLLNKWDEIVALILNNSFYLFCSGTYNELLKFLVNTIDTKWAEVNVIINNEEIIVFDKAFKHCLIKNTDNIIVLTELIGFSPNTINIYCNNVVDCPAFSSILDIFQEKVKIKPLSSIQNI